MPHGYRLTMSPCSLLYWTAAKGSSSSPKANAQFSDNYAMHLVVYLDISRRMMFYFLHPLNMRLWWMISSTAHQRISKINANGIIFCQISPRFLLSVPFPANHGLSNHFTCRSWKPPFNLSPYSAAYMRQWIGSALVKIMACRHQDII